MFENIYSRWDDRFELCKWHTEETIFFYTRTYETVHSRYKLHYPDQKILIHAPKTNIPFQNKQNWSSCLGVNDFPSSFAVLHGLDCFQMFRPTLLTASSMVIFNSLLSFVSRMGSTWTMKVGYQRSIIPRFVLLPRQTLSNCHMVHLLFHNHESANACEDQLWKPLVEAVSFT